MGHIIVRLKRRIEFLRIARTGRKSVTPGLILQARIREPHDRPAYKREEPRVGFTTSRKVGNAVNRNRVRRRLRAVAEQILSIHAKSGIDYVLIGRKTTLERSYRKLVNDLVVSLKRLDSWKEKDPL